VNRRGEIGSLMSGQGQLHRHRTRVASQGPDSRIVDANEPSKAIDRRAEVASQGGELVRAAEVIAALSLATDLGIGVPLEHGLHSPLLAMRLGERLGVDQDTASQTYYACLLFYVGCTADAEVAAGTFGDDDALTRHALPARFGSRPEMTTGILRALADPGSPAPVRALQMARGMPRAARELRGHVTAFCEVAQMLTDRLGLPASVQGLFAYLVERWDGKGLPGRARGEAIPLPVRIASVARDAAFQRMLGGPEHAARVVRLGGDAGPRARPAADPGGRGDRAGPGGDGRLRRPCLAVPGRPLGRGGRAGHGGGAAVPSRARRAGHPPARRAGARSRARGSWIDLPVFGAREHEPEYHRGVVASQPGLYFVGLPFLYAMSSGFLPGVDRDAEHVVHAILAGAGRTADRSLPWNAGSGMPTAAT
jgi:hypothetical protein